MRDGNAANKQNWKLVCSGCGAEFANDETVSLIEGHHQESHPDMETPAFNLMWVGKGPKPKGPKEHRNPRRKR